MTNRSVSTNMSSNSAKLKHSMVTLININVVIVVVVRVVAVITCRAITGRTPAVVKTTINQV